MDSLRKWLDRGEEKLKNSRFKRFYPLYEAMDSFFYTERRVTSGSVHVRDAVDLKRVMITVVVALMPCALMAMYNTGLQANLVIQSGGQWLPGWRTSLAGALGVSYRPESFFDCFVHGLVYYLPVLVVTFVVGLGWEVVFAIVRGHAINEGFFVTGMIFPLILPATIPLWQVALAISFGVIIGKEVFGGTGYNIFNPAMTGRAFLFFSYPANITGDAVWVVAEKADVVTGATPLASVAHSGLGLVAQNVGWWDAFVGFIPGSMGETSALACLIGAVILLATGVASWRIMLMTVVGVMFASWTLSSVGSESNLLFAVPFWWHLVIGGTAFVFVFMATDPVSAPHTQKGQLVYGFLVGAFAIMVRVLNPAYPDGLIVAVLFMNAFAPLIDHIVIRLHVRKRRAAHAS